MEAEKIDNAPSQRRLTLRKGEKLRHRTLVNGLFAEGASIYDYPLRLVWRKLTPEELDKAFRIEPPPRLDRLQMLITVPKKKRRHAVDRVLMRRRIRESYRLSRIPLLEQLEKHPEIGTLSLAFIYLSADNAPSDRIRLKMEALLSRLASKL